MTPASTSKAAFAARIRNRQPVVGPLLRMPNETLVELTGHVGMDFVLIDTEHGPGDQIPLAAHLTSADAVGLPALVRVGALGEVLRALDLGAAGIVVPHVSSAAQAEAAVRAARYPPRGDRGFATYSRAARHGLATAAEHLAVAEATTVLIAMIEDRAGVDAAADIAAVDGVDALFVGPADLSVALGHPGQTSHPEVTEAIAAVRRAAEGAGIGVVGIVPDVATGRARFAAGCTIVVYNTLAALGTLFSELATGRPKPESAAAESVPLIALPGMLGTTEVWDEVAGRLAEAGLAVRGARIDLDDSIAGMADSVLATAPVRFDLVGHSLGGIVALEIVRRAPDRVRRLVLMNASGRGPSATQLTHWQNLRDQVRGRFADLVQEQARINLGAAAGISGTLDTWVDMAHRVGPDGYERQLIAQSTRPDSLPELSGVSVDVLVISGECDEVAPPDLQRELAERIPRARHVTIPGSGHLTPLDAAPAVADLLIEFLRP